MLLLLLLAEGRLRRGPEPARPVPGLLQGGPQPDRLARVSGGDAASGRWRWFVYAHSQCAARVPGGGVVQLPRGQVFLRGAPYSRSHREVELPRLVPQPG